MKRFSSPLKPAAIASAFVLALIANVPTRAQQAPAAPATTTTTTTTTTSPELPNVAVPNPSEAPVELSPFEVQESSNAGYGATTTSSASRVAQNYIDVPQVVNVITSQFINDFNIMDNQRIFEFVPNMLIDNSDAFYIRGIAVGLTYINGVEAGTTPKSLPMQFFDRVEVVKGPSSAAFGLGEPGGIINYISKTPTGRTDGEVTVGFGDHNNYLANFDFEGRGTGKLSNLEYRLVGMYDSGWSVIKNISYHEDVGVQLSLKNDFNSTTSSQLIVSYSNDGGPQQSDQSNWARSQTGIDTLAFGYGLPLLPKVVGPNVDLTAVGWGNIDRYIPFRGTFITDKSLFDNHVNLRLTLTAENVPHDELYTQIDNIYNPAPGVYTTGMDRWKVLGTTNDIAANIDAEAHYTWGTGLATVSSRSLAGFDIRQQRDDSQQFGPPDINADGTLHTVNFYDPNLEALYTPSGLWTNPQGVVESPVIWYDNHSEDDIQYGFYIQQELTFLDGRVTLLGGYRVDFFKDVYSDILSGTVTNPGWQNSKPGAPRAAITIKPFKWLSFFGLYTQHRDPTEFAHPYGLSIRGDIQPSTIAEYNNFQTVISYQPLGTDIEGGAKATFLDGKLTVSIDVFHTILRGSFSAIDTIIIKDPDGSDTQIVAGSVTGNEVHGTEIEIFGQPTKRLSIILGYGLTRGMNFPVINNQPYWIDQPTEISGHGKLDLGDLRGNGFYLTFGGIWYSGYWLEQAPPPYLYWNSNQYSIDAGGGFRWDHGRQTIYASSDNVTNQYNTLALQGRGYTVYPREQAFLTYKYTW